MALIDGAMGLLFGGSRGVVRDAMLALRESADAASDRTSEMQAHALQQMAQEFAAPKQNAFDRFMDGLNRMPRPLLALGTLGLFVAAMVDPLWFGERMQGVALVPEPLWWLLGVIVSFYFGARHQVKAQEFQREIVSTVARAPQVMENIRALRELRHDDKGVADAGPDAALEMSALEPDANPALDDWRKGRA